MNSSHPVVRNAICGAILASAGLAVLPLPRRWRADPAAPQFGSSRLRPRKAEFFWEHVNGMSDERHLPETVGAGCAFLDFDNDGWMDIYFVNSGPSTSTLLIERSEMPCTAITGTARSPM